MAFYAVPESRQSSGSAIIKGSANVEPALPKFVSHASDFT